MACAALLASVFHNLTQLERALAIGRDIYSLEKEVPYLLVAFVEIGVSLDYPSHAHFAAAKRLNVTVPYHGHRAVLKEAQPLRAGRREAIIAYP